MKARPRRREAAGPARERAFEILLRVETDDAFASRLLDHHESALEDARESALLHEIVLGVLRFRRVLDHALAQVSNRPPAEIDPDVRVALWIGAYALLYLDRVPDFAAVHSAVELVKARGLRSATGFVNGVLRALSRSGASVLPARPERGDIAGLSTYHSHPEWWVRRVVERLGWEAASRLLDADNRPAPTTLRPNLRKTTPRDLERRLLGEGVRTEPGRVVDDALRVTSGRVRLTRTFGDGYAWIQDEASQLVPRLFGRILRSSVLDACAAPGTKSLQLTEALPVEGVVIAADLRARRLERLTENARRLGITTIRTVVADMERPPFRERFEHVLVDAPCSGTGTLRRHPEIRWRLASEDLPVLAARQSRILAAAAGLLARGGTLVYAVCSMEPEEGEQVVSGFLADRPDFRRLDPTPALPERARRLVRHGSLMTSPAEEGLDGFYGAIVARG